MVSKREFFYEKGVAIKKRRSSAFYIRDGEIEAANENGEVVKVYNKNSLIGDLDFFFETNFVGILKFKAVSDVKLVEFSRELMRQYQGTKGSPKSPLDILYMKEMLELREEFSSNHSIEKSLLESDEFMQEKIQPMVELMEIEDAIENDEFVIQAQPLIQIETREVVGVECLCRWKKPGVKNLIGPYLFIDKATHSWFSERFQLYILEKCFSIAKTLLNSYPDKKLFTSINITPRHLNQKLFERCEYLSQLHAVPSELIKLELLESEVLNSENRDIIKVFSAHGYKLALDDFGAGNSNLDYIGVYECSTVKIDRNMLLYLGQLNAELAEEQLKLDNSSETTSIALEKIKKSIDVRKAFIETMISLFLKFDYEVIVEGIETEEELIFLQSISNLIVCQGWVFSADRSIDKLLEYINSGPNFLRS